MRSRAGKVKRKPSVGSLGLTVHRCQFQKLLGIELGFDAGGDVVVAGFLAGEAEEQGEREKENMKFVASHAPSQS